MPTANHLLRLLLGESSVCRILIVLCCLATRASAAPDTARFYALLYKGDSIYSEKQGYASFLQSLRCFDSAQLIAEQSRDAGLLARATFARGRIYDAWNREPLKTIDLFTQAATLFRQAGRERQYFYAKHLVAHAYDKIGDSAHATAVLRELIEELSRKDTAARHSLRFISEMALIATEVHAYALADSILKRLTRRSWIANDPDTYNYLDHYYLTQSRLDVFGRRLGSSLYLDSLAATFEKLPSPLDRLFYALQLADLNAAVHNYSAAFRFRTIQADLQAALSADKDFEKLQRALAESETAAERRKLSYEKALRQSRTWAIRVLSFLLIVITVLSLYLYHRNKKYRAQSRTLRVANTELDSQFAKVKLLNKEIQHRVKNNLYTIYSLLHMQQESTDNEEVIAHLEAARLRVESIAALHDQLLAGGNALDFGSYLKTLISKIVTCYDSERKVVTHIDTEPITLPPNNYFALSLILNEWVTNSIKYAGEKGEVLQMNVRIANAPGEVLVDYSDSGRANVAPSAGKGLGTEIVQLLTAQVKGRLSQVNGHPYHYDLRIPNEQPH